MPRPRRAVPIPTDNEALLDGTLAVLQPTYDGTLTREDAREIASNLIGFFRVLRDWERAEAAGQTGQPPEDDEDTDAEHDEDDR